MPKLQYDDALFQPARKKKDKSKRHSRGFNEEALDKRAQRISFKKYVRDISEAELESDYDDYESDN
jgi:hypothetical protein